MGKLGTETGPDQQVVYPEGMRRERHGDSRHAPARFTE